MTTLVEVCAGSAALTRHQLGLGKLVGFMGGKDGYAAAIVAAWGCPVLDAVWLNDPGLWGDVWLGLVLDPAVVAGVVAGWTGEPPRLLWERCRSTKATGYSELAAARLCQLAGTYGGAEVGRFKGRHVRRPSVDGFIPSLVTLAARVAAVRFPVPVTTTALDAAEVEVSGAWCYVDPPYRGTTGYAHELPRERVVEVALRLAQRNRVAVSEGGPVAELVEAGWSAHELTAARVGQRRRNSRSSAEWLTVSPREGGRA